jgi:uncharacterized protein YmfQ (DUF2313 family)
MGLSQANYKNLIIKLLPQGQAWRGANLTALVQAFAIEAKRMSDKIEQIFAEAIPSTASDCLSDWESVCGLPESGTSLASTTLGRQNNVIARLVATGGQNAAYFEQIGASLGYDVTITDAFRPFHVGNTVGNALYSTAWMFVFEVNVTNASAADVIFENIVNKYKPAHTTALFEWAGS